MIKKRAYERLDAPHVVSWFEPNRMFSSPGVTHAHDSLDSGSIIASFTETCWDEEEEKATVVHIFSFRNVHVRGKSLYIWNSVLLQLKCEMNAV